MSSFPTVLFGPVGEEFNRYVGSRGSGLQLNNTAQRWPFGTQLIMQSGDKFRFSLAGATDLVIGNVEQAAINVANHVGLTAVASAINSRSPVATLGATASTADQYAGGYVVVSVTPDGGQVYRINDHAVAAASANQTVNLVPGHQIQAAWTTATRVSLIKHPYDGVIQAPVTTQTAPAVGICVRILSAYSTSAFLTTNSFGWLQTRGIASVLLAGTLVIGQAAVLPASVAGAAGPHSATYVATENVIGIVQRVASEAGGNWTTVFLTIDG